MSPWSERPLEEANLLNPAFGCLVLTSFAEGYTSVDGKPVPLPLAFLALPVVLHPSTRERLPRATSTSLGTWLSANPEVRIGLAERAIALRPHAREAVLFGTAQGWLSLGDDVGLAACMTGARIRSAGRGLEGDAAECVGKARLVGKWFALAGPWSTVMALWGVRP